MYAPKGRVMMGSFFHKHVGRRLSDLLNPFKAFSALDCFWNAFYAFNFEDNKDLNYLCIPT